MSTSPEPFGSQLASPAAMIPLALLSLPPSSEPSSPLTDLSSTTTASGASSPEEMVLLDDHPHALDMLLLADRLRTLGDSTPTTAQRECNNAPAPAGVLEGEYSSDHVNPSSPIRGKTHAERSAKREQKRQKHRQRDKDARAAARAQEKADRAIAAEAEAVRKEAERRAAEHEAAVEKRARISDVLSYMKGKGVTYGDILLFLSDTEASTGYGEERFRGLFAVPGRVRQVLMNWVSSSNSKTGRTAVRDWAIEYVGSLVSKEGGAVSRSHILQAFRRPIDETFAGNFKFTSLYESLYKLCPTMRALLLAFSTTTRQHRWLVNLVSSGRSNAAIKYQARRDKLIGSAMTILLRARSQRNSYAAQIMGLYLYATGSPRQVISVLSHVGLSGSYQMLAGTRRRSNLLKSAVASTVNSAERSDSELSDDSDYAPSDSSSGSSAFWSGSDCETDSDWEDLDDTTSSSSSEASPLRTPSRTQPIAAPPDARLPASRVPDAAKTSQPPKSRDGILDTLSDSCRLSLRARAQAPRRSEDDGLANVYDNINFMFRAAEQILGRTDSQENGTCATAFSLYKAPHQHLRTADLVRSFTAAPPLAFKDIRLTAEETGAVRERLIWTVMNIVVQHGGESFKQFKDRLTSAPPSTHRIPLHKTEVFPMPAMEIDESSTTGNAQVLDSMFTEMGYKLDSPEFSNTIKLVFGDQLSMARVRAITNTRVGHDDPSKSYLNVVFAPGFFHYQMAGTHGVLETHWGDPSLSARDPGSLSFHNSVLQRKPIVLSSLPPYRTCRDLTFVSLYARVLHCLELVSGHEIADYPSTTSFAQFKTHAAAIVDEYANPAKAAALRGAWEEAAAGGKQSEPATPGGASQPQDSAEDPVFHNAVLFLRDALLLRHFADAIKSGSSDHLVCVLKLWALGFRAMGRVKYAHELLHLVHNLMHVWPRELREIIMNNWLVNTTGGVDGFIPVDLLQEHLNFWIKVIYKAHGSNASWEWLQTISPCIEVLRRLAREISAELGAKQGVKHHAPDLTKDIRELMGSLRKHAVYVQESDRPDRDSVKLVPNVYSAGIHSLAGPLAEYNKTFAKMQERRKMKPVIGESALKTFGVENRGTASTAQSPHSPSSSGDCSPTPPSDSDSDSDGAGSTSDSDSEHSELDGAPGGGDEITGDGFGDVFFTLDSPEDVELDMDGF